MASLGSLVVSLAVDTAKFQGDLGRAAAIAESRMRNIKDTTQKAIAAFAAVGGAIGGALVAATKQGIDAADSMRDAAAAAGTTVENMSRLGFAAKQSGADIDVVKKALVKLANDGAKDSVAALIGLADQFEAMPDGAKKTALAVQLFGERIGPGLVPLLNEGSAGIKAMADEADALGITISTSAAAGADQFNDTLGTLNGVVTGFKNNLAAALLPTLNNIADELLSTAKNTDAMDRAVRIAASGVKLLLSVAEVVRAVFSNLGNILGGLAAALVQLAQGNFSEAWSILKDGFDDVRQSGEESATRLLAIWDDTSSSFAGKSAPMVTAIEKVSTASKKATRDVIELGQAAKEGIARGEEYWQNIEFRAGLAESISTSAAESIREITSAMEDQAPKVQAVNEQMTAFADEAARGMQSAFADFLFDPFKDGLKGMLAGFIDTVRRMIAEAAAAEILKSFFSFVSNSTTGGVSSFFGKLAGRAIGGPVSSGTPYMVGERGPELFVPGATGTIVPNHALGMGGSVVINQSFDFRGADADRVAAMMPGWGRQIKSETIAEVRNLIARGRL